ncbi:hypothetical protein [Dactylosporangium darangshiense]|uniref:hypothetical protein n=1 Tax=Dactylosporangium darangshiense TaxID=579108 RepID=UPI00362D10C7
MSASTCRATGSSRALTYRRSSSPAGSPSAQVMRMPPMTRSPEISGEASSVSPLKGGWPRTGKRARPVCAESHSVSASCTATTSGTPGSGGMRDQRLRTSPGTP